MANLTWYTRMADRQVAEVPAMRVTFVAQTFKSGGTRSSVYVGDWRPGDEWPGESSVHHTLVAQITAIGDMDRAKANCLRAFENWAGDVSRIVNGE
jgi:hypothetical protein